MDDQGRRLASKRLPEGWMGLEGTRVVARAHQSTGWLRTRETNRLRNRLREYYPGALATFDHLDALAVLAKAPDPERGARLSLSQIKAALRSGGRRRYLEDTAVRIQAGCAFSSSGPAYGGGSLRGHHQLPNGPDRSFEHPDPDSGPEIGFTF